MMQKGREDALVIQPLTTENAPQAVQLCTFARETGWGAQGIAAEINSTASLARVAFFGGQPAVFCAFTCAAGEANLNLVVTAPHYRQRGFAAQVLHSAMVDLLAKGVQEVYLEVRLHATPAHALYKKLGFETVGLRKNFYTNPTEDALVMKKELGGDTHENSRY